MSPIDDSIVSIRFDNKAFQNSVADTIKSLDALRASLVFTDGVDFTSTLASLSELSEAGQNIDFSNAEIALSGLSSAANGMDFSTMSKSLDSINSKFSAMGAIGFTVLQNLTTGVMDFGGKLFGLAKANVWDQIIGGGTKRSENIEQAKFMFRGLGIDVDAAMESALSAVRGTAYGLGSAAKAAAQFGASGLKAGEEMTSALRGVAGAAAMTGSSFEEIADIFAGSAGSGRVTGMDLQQFSTRGLNAAAALAKVWNTTEAEVREMASAGELDFKKFADGMDLAFGKHATKANELYSGSLANMRAALSRIGATIVTPKLEQQRDLFNAITPLIDKIHTAIKPVISAFIDWRRIGIDKLIARITAIDLTNFTEGMIKVGHAIRDLFFSASKIAKTVQTGFRDIFPQTATSTLVDMTELLRKFAAYITIVLLNVKNLEYLRQIFAGIFAVFSIGWAVVKGVFNVLRSLFTVIAPSAGKGTGGILSFVAAIGTALVKLEAFLVKGGKLSAFFEALAKLITPPIVFIKAFISVIFGAIRAAIDFEKTFDRLGKAMETPIAFIKDLSNTVSDFFSTTYGSTPVQNTMDRVGQRAAQTRDAWRSLMDFMEQFERGIGRVVDRIAFYTATMRDKISKIWGPADFKPGLDALNTGFFGVLIYMMHKLTTSGARLTVGLGANFNQAMLEVKKTLQTFTASIKVDMLFRIAKAIALIAASLVVLALMDSAALSRAVGAITLIFAQLIGFITLLDKGVVNSKTAKFQNSTTAKFLGLSVVLTAMSTAILILAGAMKLLGSMDAGELAAGFAAITGGLAIMVVSLRTLGESVKTQKAAERLVTVSKALVIMSASLILLAIAIKILSLMSWKTFAEGLSRIAVGLALLVLALNFMPNNQYIMAAAAAVGILAYSLALMAATIILYNRIPWKTLIFGLIKVGAAIAIIGFAMRSFPDQGHLIAAAGALLVVGIALLVITKSIKALAKIKGGQLISVVLTIAAVLAALAIAVHVFQSALPGALVMVIVASSLLILSNAVEKLGRLKFTDLIKGFAALVLIIVVLVAALAALSYIAPALGALGVAMVLLAGSVTLFGVGIFFLAAGLAMLSKTGVKGAQALAKVMQTLVIIAISLVQAAGNILNAILDELGKLVDKVAIITVNFVFAILKAIMDNLPAFIDAGVIMFIRLVDGFLKHKDDFVDAIVMLVYGLADSIHKKHKDIQKAFGTLALAFVELMLGAIVDKIPSWLGGNKIRDMMDDAFKGAEKALKAYSPSKVFEDLGKDADKGLAKGIDGSNESEKSTDDWMQTLIDAMSGGLKGGMKGLPGLDDIEPTVTPVMDLSNIESGLGDMNSMFANNGGEISPNISADFANQLSAAQQPQSQPEESNQTTPTEVTYVQNNYSPKALSTNDIYRNTKSQIAIEKEELSIS